jgi:hypothetical protein
MYGAAAWRGVVWHGRPAGLCALRCGRRGAGSQAFNQASAFNQNIGSWNTASVMMFDYAFGSGGEGEGEGEGVGLADCFKRSVYDNWGSMLQMAYPSWSSLSALCSTPRCESRPVAMRALGTRRIGA